MAAKALNRNADVIHFGPPMRALLTLLFAAGMTGGSTAADTASDREAQMAAAYVFNFVKFVEWPAAELSADIMRICFVGADSVRAALADATSDKQVGTRRIVVRKVASTQGTQSCDVVYVDSKIEQRLSAVSNGAALTVGDSKDFTREGGVIGLYTESNRLRFVINVDNARRAGLQVSSNLLKLATRIEQGTSQ